MHPPKYRSTAITADKLGPVLRSSHCAGMTPNQRRVPREEHLPQTFQSLSPSRGQLVRLASMFWRIPLDHAPEIPTDHQAPNNPRIVRAKPPALPATAIGDQNQVTTCPPIRDVVRDMRRTWARQTWPASQT